MLEGQLDRRSWSKGFTSLSPVLLLELIWRCISEGIVTIKSFRPAASNASKIASALVAYQWQKKKSLYPIQWASVSALSVFRLSKNSISLIWELAASAWSRTSSPTHVWVAMKCRFFTTKIPLSPIYSVEQARAMSTTRRSYLLIWNLPPVGSWNIQCRTID